MRKISPCSTYVIGEFHVLITLNCNFVRFFHGSLCKILKVCPLFSLTLKMFINAKKDSLHEFFQIVHCPKTIYKCRLRLPYEIGTY